MLEVARLTKILSSRLIRKRYLKAVDDVSFKIETGRTLGLVGESRSSSKARLQVRSICLQGADFIRDVREGKRDV